MKREFTRKEYEKVKKMDRREMELYIEEKINKGIEEGVKMANNNKEELNEFFGGLVGGECKGIGVTNALKVIKFAREKGVIKEGCEKC